MTDEPLPAPLTPAHIDLRDLSYMPLEVVRLRNSKMARTPSAEAFRAAVLLWCAAWHEVPAGSLPDDEDELIFLSGCRTAKRWNSIRAEALRGFVQCNDGRLYHPVVAERAVEAWEKVQKHRKQTAAATAARKGKTNKNSGNPDRNDDETKPSDDRRNGQRIEPRPPDRNVHQGKGSRREEEESEQQRDSIPAARARASGGLSAEDQKWATLGTQLVDLYETRNCANPVNTNHVEIWRDLGYDPNLCLTVVRSTLGSKPGFHPGLKYFDNPIAEHHQKVRDVRRDPAPAAAPPTYDWDRFMDAYCKTQGQVWLGNPMPRPGSATCPVPQDVIEKYRPRLNRLDPTTFPLLNS